MKAFGRFIQVVGRFAVGFGSGLALVCAYVIVTTDVRPGRPVVVPGDIVRLDPIVVTISAGRFAEIQAELSGTPVLVRTPDYGFIEG